MLQQVYIPLTVKVEVAICETIELSFPQVKFLHPQLVTTVAVSQEVVDMMRVNFSRVAGLGSKAWITGKVGLFFFLLGYFSLLTREGFLLR